MEMHTRTQHGDLTDGPRRPRPVGYLLNGLAAATFVLWLIVAAFPGPFGWSGPDLCAGITIICGPLFLPWVAIIAWWSFKARACARHGGVVACLGWPWRVVPILGLVLLILLLTRAPLRLSFWLHQPALERLARQKRAPQATTPGWVGLYPITGVADIQGPPGRGGRWAVLINTAPSYVGGGAGFLYAPGSDSHTEGVTYKPRYGLEVTIHVALGDGWYTCSCAY